MSVSISCSEKNPSSYSIEDWKGIYCKGVWIWRYETALWKHCVWLGRLAKVGGGLEAHKGPPSLCSHTQVCSPGDCGPANLHNLPKLSAFH